METSLWFGSSHICAGWWQLSEAKPGHGTWVWPRGWVLLLHAAPLLVPWSPPGLQGKGGCQQFWPPGEEPRWFFNFSFCLEIWKAFPHPCKPTTYMWYFYRKQPTCLSDQWATGMVCSSWSPRALLAQVRGVRKGWTGRPIGRAWSPSLPFSCSPSTSTPKPAPLWETPYAQLGARSQQSSCLAPKAAKLHPQPVHLGVFFGICLPNKLSVRSVLTQASYYQSQGAEVGKSTKTIGGNDFRANLENKHTSCWVVWDSLCWFRGLKTWYCSAGLQITPFCLVAAPVCGFPQARLIVLLKGAGFRTHCPCEDS